MIRALAEDGFVCNDATKFMPQRRLSVHNLRLFSSIAFFVLAVPLVHSKDVTLTAIELFDGDNGPSYVQLTGLLINGKAEVRSCGGFKEINKGTYGKLTKIPLAAGDSLERDAHGTMSLLRGSSTECVVPSNMKYDKDESLTPSQLADHTDLNGQVLASSVNGVSAVPQFKPGVKLVFVSAPDTELAEYLRALRAHTTIQWRDYLGRYPKTEHTDSAKQALAALLEKEGEDGLLAYRKSASSATPSYSDLKTARLRYEQCLELVPSYEAAAKLGEAVRGELVSVVGKSQAEWQSYKDALAGHTNGYAHLASARKLIDRVIEVDPHFEPGKALQTSILAEVARVDKILDNAESLATAQRFDDAAAALVDLRDFGEEEPRIAAIIADAYKYHFDRGKGLANEQKWHEAAQEYQKASDFKKTQEVLAALKEARAESETTKNRAAADAALQQSSDFEQSKDYIQAYEVLANLPEAQRKLVQENLSSLEPNYIKSASGEAKKLNDVHAPIHGRNDELGILKAYDYLRRISELQPDDQNLSLRLALISGTLSDYYVQQAKRYLDKPLGSGVGIGWLYLDEAQQYQSNRDDVRDERTKSLGVHNVRSSLSIRVAFRDQTSRRVSSGFAEQLSDSISTGLETTGLPIKVTRQADTPAAEPNFQLIGDVLEHRTISNPTVESLESEYRATEREIPNENWNKADLLYEAANLNLQKAQKDLEAANQRGKKKEISAASDAVDDAQKKVLEARGKLDAIPKTNLSGVNEPYTYTKKTIDLTAIVEIGFRIVDSYGNTIGATPSIKRSAHKQFVVVENVKPEDTKGIKQSGSPPDEAQFLTDVEVEARDALIHDVKEKIEALPSKILADARRHSAEGDIDGAAESYILYLNSTPNDTTAERVEAKKFLKEQFNMAWPGTAVARDDAGGKEQPGAQATSIAR
jgi:hypothetical protein